MLEESSARCTAHSAPAVGACERCGTFVCDLCSFHERGHLRCHSCGPPETERPPPAALAALLLSATGLLCPPLSLIGLGMAVVWRARHRERAGLGAQYARWALVVGALSLVASAAIYGLAISVAVQSGAFRAIDPARP